MMVSRPWLRGGAVLLLLLLLGLVAIYGSSQRRAQPLLQPVPSVTPSINPVAPRVTPHAPSLTPDIAAPQPLSVTPNALLSASASPGPTVAADLALEWTSLKANEYLGTVAQRYGVSLDEIVAFSGITNPDVVPIGQGLIIPHRPGRTTPDTRLLPDSELVYGVAYTDFDLHDFVQQAGGRLAQVTLTGLDGASWNGADAVERVAMRYSVGPRVLLALMEAGSGWVTDPDPQGLAADYPLGHTNGGPGLLPQLEWAANTLNRGFYGWQDRGETAIRSEDGQIARGAPGLNPGTVAVQRVLAADVSFDRLPARLAEFDAAYRRLFGDPFDLDAGPVLPADLQQPLLHLPWAVGEWWHLTGGPHGAWVSGSGWAALDFVPEGAQIGTCTPAAAWAVAAAPGVVVRSTPGEILLDLDGDGDMRTGWVLQYLHVVDTPALGAVLAQDDPVGRPSCEGGAAATTHLHVARRYNGLWVAAGGPVPMTLDGWAAYGGFEYEGGMRKPGQPDRLAEHSREREVNGLLREE
ncbi:MAG: LysM domain-containing protein [Caldilineales bacterium]